jgi:hypothetical protein
MSFSGEFGNGEMRAEMEYETYGVIHQYGFKALKG